MEHLMANPSIMRKTLPTVALAIAFAWADEPKVELKPMSLGAVQEMGQLGRGAFNIGSNTQYGEIFENEWIDHFGAFINQQAVINDRLLLTGGVGGIFQFRKPELALADFKGSLRKDFFIGPTEANAVYSFGDIEKPVFKLGVGMFPYKYNPEAVNLGEYLYRANAYPGYIVTGGYLVAGNTAAWLQGVKAGLSLGSFKTDILLTTETGIAPLYDWSLGLVASYSIADGLLDLGAGVNFKRLIPIKPSRTRREFLANGYFEQGGKGYSTNVLYANEPLTFYRRQLDDPTIATNAADSARIAALMAPYQADSAVVAAAFDPANPTPPKIQYFTSAATLLMARATFDAKKLFGGGAEAMSPNDLKLFFEAAVLGVKDYPVYYDDIMERIPIMAGINVPTFKLLDLFCIQVERYKSPWLNNTTSIGNFATATPFLPFANDKVVSEKEYNDLATKDDFKWSILLQKKLGSNVTFSAQVASDHLHLVNAGFYYGPNFDHNEITVTREDWYWIAQLGWGI